MLEKRDAKKEEKIIEELISGDESLRRQHELFEAEMAFKQELINARKSAALTQQEVSRITGLSQQAVSRMEKSASGTIETIIRYLDSLGYSLTIRKKV